MKKEKRSFCLINTKKKIRLRQEKNRKREKYWNQNILIWQFNLRTKRKIKLTQRRTMRFSVFMIFPVLLCFECLMAKPLEQGSSATEAVVDVTPYPDAQKRYVDINNVSPEVSSILRENNVNLDHIKTLQAKLQNKTNRDYYHVIPSSTYPAPTAAKE